jgi:hypothetical protein
MAAKDALVWSGACNGSVIGMVLLEVSSPNLATDANVVGVLVLAKLRNVSSRI